jgi:hypothetical protein
MSPGKPAHSELRIRGFVRPVFLQEWQTQGHFIDLRDVYGDELVALLLTESGCSNGLFGYSVENMPRFLENHPQSEGMPRWRFNLAVLREVRRRVKTSP